MIIILLSSLFTLFFVLSIVLLIRGISLVRQNETLQDIVVENQEEREQTQEVLENMLKQMREIDLRGSFESDDEVGSVFTQLKDLIESYNEKE
jgi:ABC-type multidrug transport system fused ATPase/permease subunit